MILSNADILKQMDNASIFISPYNEENLRPSSYCLTLSNNIVRFKTLETTVKLLDETTYPKAEKINISNENPYSISPGEFVLGSSLETIMLPNSISGFLSNISGLARLGLNVLLSTHVAAGFGSKKQKSIIFEIHNISTHSIELIPNIRICHLILVNNLTSATQGYDELFPNKYTKGYLSEYFDKT